MGLNPESGIEVNVLKEPGSFGPFAENRLCRFWYNFQGLHRLFKNMIFERKVLEFALLYNFAEH